jgi:recombination protein RecA
LKENPDIRSEIANKIRESYGLASSNYVIGAHEVDEDEELELLLGEE